MVSGKPYISTKRATIKAEKAPKDLQSSFVFGFTKLKAKNINIAEAKMEDIKQKIQDLSCIKDALEHITEMCDGHGPLEGCPILEALDNQEDCEH